MRLDKIFANNERWVREKVRSDSGFFTRLAQGQHPDILYIGCSDSRVTAEEMTGAHPGDLLFPATLPILLPITTSTRCRLSSTRSIT